MEKYIMPQITVELLSKSDVLCASAESDSNTPDNVQQHLLNLPSWWD